MPCFRKENPFWPLDLKKIESTPATIGGEIKHEQMKHLSELNIDLYSILEREIAAGNKIVETSSGWPTPESIFVMLEKPFMTKNLKLPNHIVFREVNDRQYWKAEFTSESSKHILACRY